ncbi:MAG: hypothetical protein H7836_15135 [Magnetococcus sp. YQC-3]
MSVDTGNLVEQIARIICRHDYIYSVTESMGSMEKVYTIESMNRAYPGEVGTRGKAAVRNRIIGEIVDRSWEDYVDPAKEIVKKIKKSI